MPNLKAQRWRWVEVPFLVTSFLWHASRLARRERPDVVHAHWIIPAGMVAAALKRFSGIPYVVTVHGADAYTLNGALARGIKRWVTNGAGAVAAVSRDIATVMARSARSEGTALIPVVPMGVDVESIGAAVGERGPEGGRFLFVGRLAEKKGLDVLIEGLARVPEATLVVVGDGPERKASEALADDAGVRSRVRFAGRLPRSEVLQELRVATAVVIPSKIARGGDQEGTPLVLSEAMAAGVPVIASRLGGLAEHLEDGETGLLVEPGSVESLAAAMQTAVHDPGLMGRCAERAGRHVRDELDLRHTRDRYVELIRAAAGGERAAVET